MRVNKVLIVGFFDFDSLENHLRDIRSVCHEEVRENEVCE